MFDEMKHDFRKGPPDMRSDMITKGLERTPHRALLKGTGVPQNQMDKPFIGDPVKPLSESQYPQAIRLLYATSLLMAALTFLSLLAGGAGVWGLLGLLR